MTSRLPARRIMIIRHAEKPLGTPGSPIGVTAAGEPDEHALTVKGWQRAGALGLLFAAPPRGSGLSVPGALACPSYADGDATHRVYQTLQPLAAKLNLSIQALGSPDAPGPAIALAVAPAAPDVLICWDHENIPALAALIPCADPVPTIWPDATYDQIWVFDRIPRHAPATYTFARKYQQALAGDVTSGGSTRPAPSALVRCASHPD